MTVCGFTTLFGCPPSPAPPAVLPLSRLLPFCFVALAAPAPRAEVVTWLYDAEAPVASQSADERRRAARLAMAEVLARVTGMAELPAHPALADALQRPDDFYSRFRFANRRPGGPAAEPPELSLAVQFERDAVLDLLRAAALPVWSADRPAILAWLAMERDGRRELVAAGEGNPLAQALTRRARQRGLALSLPLLDMADLAVDASDVWGLFWERIEKVSARYGADLLLVGRARQGRLGAWTVDWHLRVRGGEPRRLYDTVALDSLRPKALAAPFDMAFEQRAADARTAGRLALDQIADALARRFAVRGDLGAVAAVATGIDDIDRYAALLEHLYSREYIERVEIVAVRGHRLELRLHSRSDIAQLGELLPMGADLAATVRRKAPAPVLELSWRSAP